MEREYMDGFMNEEGRSLQMNTGYELLIRYCINRFVFLSPHSIYGFSCHSLSTQLSFATAVRLFAPIKKKPELFYRIIFTFLKNPSKFYTFCGVVLILKLKFNKLQSPFFKKGLVFLRL